MCARLFIIDMLRRLTTLFDLLDPFEKLRMHVLFRVVELDQVEGEADHLGVPLVFHRYLPVCIDDAGQLSFDSKRGPHSRAPGAQRLVLMIRGGRVLRAWIPTGVMVLTRRF